MGFGGRGQARWPRHHAGGSWGQNPALITEASPAPIAASHGAWLKNVLGVRWPAVRGLEWKASLSPLCRPSLMVGLLKLYL